MPYIEPWVRENLAKGRDANTPGELNYAITTLMISWCEQKGINYKTLSEAHSQATLAAAEFYRRAIAPYEDRKIEENGDVYPEWLFGGVQ